MSKVTLDELLKTKSYIYFLSKPLEEAKTFYEETFDGGQKNNIRDCKKYSSIRLYILFEGLIEKSRSEIEFANQRKTKLDSRSEDGEIKKESALIEKSLNKVYEINPGLKVEKNDKKVENTTDKE